MGCLAELGSAPACRPALPRGKRAIAAPADRNLVIPGHRQAVNPESRNSDPTGVAGIGGIWLLGRCSWIPGSRAVPAPRDDEEGRVRPVAGQLDTKTTDRSDLARIAAATWPKARLSPGRGLTPMTSRLWVP